MGTKPILEYYWVKVLEDGKTVIPQFDPETGKQNSWHVDTAPLSKVLFVPFTQELARKVVSNGNLAMDSLRPIIEFNVNGERAEAGILGIINQVDYFICDICGWKFQYVKTPESRFAKCPQCGTTDDWYCSRCKEYKYDYRITDKNQVQCLECKIPTGLDRTKKLHRSVDINHSCEYFIRTPTRKLTVKENGNVILE